MTISTDAPNIRSLELGSVQTDADAAREIRTEMRPLLDKFVEIMNRAKARGFTVNFTIGTDPYGRHVAPDVTVVKPL